LDGFILISNLVLSGKTIVTDMYSSFREREKVREWQRDRERRPVRSEVIILVTIQEQRT